jgi:integrase
VGQAWLDGRRQKVTGATKRDVVTKMGSLLYRDGEQHVDRRIRLQRLLRDWEKRALAAKPLAPSTLEAHHWAIELWCAELGHVLVSDLDVRSVEKALDRMAARPLSRGSLVKVRSTLRQCLAWAERRRTITYNAAAIAELPPETVPARARRALDDEELVALVGVLGRQPRRAMYVLMVSAGLRPGEAAGLCRDAVDLEAGTVTVCRGVRLTGGRPGLVDELKTSGSRRTLALAPDALAALREHVNEGLAGPTLMFPGDDGGPLWPSTMRAELAEFCRAAGIEPVRPVELRHTCATRLANAGLPAHQVADVLGHRTTRMVDQYYRHRPPLVRGAELCLISAAGDAHSDVGGAGQQRAGRRAG